MVNALPTGLRVLLVVASLMVCSASMANTGGDSAVVFESSQSGKTADAPRFQQGDGAIVSRMLAAFLGLGLVAGLAWYISSRSGGPLAGWLKQQGVAKGTIEVMQVRRISPRLTIVALNILGERQIVLADNGQALLVLSDEKRVAPAREGS